MSVKTCQESTGFGQVNGSDSRGWKAKTRSDICNLATDCGKRAGLLTGLITGRCGSQVSSMMGKSEGKSG